MNGLTFEQWKLRVDGELVKLVGMTSDGMPDWDYYSAYDDNVPPKVAARRALKNATTY